VETERTPAIPPSGGFLARIAGMAAPHGRPIARLVRVEGQVSIDGARPVELWGRAGALGPEFGEAGLQAALAFPENAWLLRAMAGLPTDGPIPHFVGREVGGAMDVAAGFGHRVPRLLLLDVKGLHPPGHADWLAQARRNAVAALPHLHLDPLPEVRLVTLGGLPDHAPAEEQGRLADGLGQPRIEFEAWGFLPFALPRLRPFAHLDTPGAKVPATEWDVLALFGPAARMRRGEAVEALREQLSGAEEYAFGWASPERSLTLSGGKEWAELRVRGHRHFVRAAVRVKTDPHRESYHPDPGDPVARRIAQLRALATGAGIRGWSFRGEHHDKGCARFEWEPETLGADGSEARALDMLELFHRALDEAMPATMR
jgi:hypothetical protein